MTRRSGAPWLAALPLLLVASFLLGAAPVAAGSYQLFESGPVRPVALSPNGQKLFVANTPDGYLEIFDVGAGGVLTPSASVAVGLEPVALAVLHDSEVWVVNHLSDSVSIVDVASSPPRVVRTLLVGDEPRDIVFAGNPLRAFISTAHRGQHRSDGTLQALGVSGTGDPQLTTEGIGRADVWVFDAANPGSALGGLPVGIRSFFADTPRALATDGNTVYVAAHHSGNKSTALTLGVVSAFGLASFSGVCGSSGEALGIPGPGINQAGDPAPLTGVILKRTSPGWVDALGCLWPSGAIPFELPDQDVFAFDANDINSGTAAFVGVGTILFNMAVNPLSGKLYVTNTESPNLVNFEGPGVFGGSTVQGHLSETRISIIDPTSPSNPVTPKHLNPHIDYGMLHTDANADHQAIDAQIPHSLATPLQVVFSDDPMDPKVYVAAFGSAKVGVFDAPVLEDASFPQNFDPTTASASYIDTGGGPAGLALSGANDRLYVLTRFDQRISVYDVSVAGGQLLQSVRLPTPEPAPVVEGRPFLYDAVATSGNGEASCASCHIFGDNDSIGWNLGNPDDVSTTNPQPQAAGVGQPDFHPMKGPMTTQTLRGMATHGALHWRGDRSNGFFGLDSCSGSPQSDAACDEALSFDNFIVAFEGLVGKNGTISTGDMQKFRAFALQLRLPPNPVANLDGTQTADQAAGETLYLNAPADAGLTCNFCHVLDESRGFFGTNGDQSEEGSTQRIKIPHLRNAYAKVGMFGLAGGGATGNQVRGFGFLHDGSIDTLFNFLDLGPFILTPTESGQVEQFLLAFPSDLAPIVGQQVSIGSGSPGSCVGADCTSCGPGDLTCADVNGRIDLLQSRAGASFDSFVLGGAVTECDLVAKTVEAGVPRGYLRLANGSFLPDDGSGAIAASALRAKAATFGQNVNYLCTPPGSGQRMGIDRDEDAVLDGLDNCSAWPNGPALGTCTAGDPALLGSRCTSSAECGTGGFCSLAQEDADFDGTGDACEPLFLPEPGSGLAGLLGAVLLAALWCRRAPVERGRSGG